MYLAITAKCLVIAKRAFVPSFFDIVQKLLALLAQIVALVLFFAIKLYHKFYDLDFFLFLHNILFIVC